MAFNGFSKGIKKFARISLNDWRTHRRFKGDVFKQLLRTFAHRYKSFMMSPGTFSLVYEHCREMEASMHAFSYTIDNFQILSDGWISFGFILQSVLLRLLKTPSTVFLVGCRI